MKLFQVVLALNLVAGVALADARTEKCINRVADACHLNLVDLAGLLANTQECKQIHPGLESVVVNNPLSGRQTLTLVNTDVCVGKQLALPGGVAQTKVIQNLMFALTNSGRVFIIDELFSAYELKNSRDTSYSSVVDIVGLKHNRGIKLVFAFGNSYNIDRDTLLSKIARGQVDRILPRDVTGGSLFW